MSTRKPPYVANFDSATAMAQALARYLAGRDFPMLGVLPKWMAPLMKLVAVAVNALPQRPQEWVYRFSGAMEALPLRRLREASTERIAQWLVDFYPQRKYPAVMIGSSDRALVHLAALCGIPWLPQTCLEPGGTLIIVDCRLRWPVTRVGERHVFQFGAVGGPTLDEYFHGGERVRAHLPRPGSARRRWTPPAPHGEAPQAEW